MQLNSLLKSIKEEASKVEVLDDSFFEFSGRTHPSENFVLEYPPEAIQLRGYQEAAVEAILSFKRGILGFSPGMGKTPTALASIRNLGGKALIVIPPSLTYDPWTKETQRLYPDLKFEVLSTRTPYPISEDTDIAIIGDSVVAWWAKALKEWSPDILVVDEAQRHKNPKAKRSSAVADIADTVRGKNGAVILMTGTLATNNATEVWMPANIAGIARSIVGSPKHHNWNTKWCYMQDMAVEKKYGPKKEQSKTIWIQIPSGCKDPIGLHNALRSTAYIRVERKDVVDMPEKLILEHGSPMSVAGAKEYSFILNDFEKWLAEKGDDPQRIAGSEKLVQLGKLVEQAALGKIEAAADYIEALVEQQEQVVVMAHHKSVVAALGEKLSEAKIGFVTFTGSDSPKNKAINLESFKNNEVPVLLGNIQSAGTGLNLENSAHLVFVQLPWSPAEFEQASDRIYRVTQTRDCTIHVLYAIGTVEQHIMEVLAKKAQVTDGINAGVGSASEDYSVVDEVFDMMM